MSPTKRRWILCLGGMASIVAVWLLAGEKGIAIVIVLFVLLFIGVFG
jgi:hypothetical protein